MPFDSRTIAASLYAHWADALSLDVPTVYPGTDPDLSGAAEWIDLALETWSERTVRETGRRLLSVGIAAHCFVKPSSEHGRVDELAEAARAALSGRTIEVRDHEESGAPLAGWIKLFEAQTRDLSRPARETGNGLRHIVARVTGIAQQS